MDMELIKIVVVIILMATVLAAFITLIPKDYQATTAIALAIGILLGGR